MPRSSIPATIPGLPFRAWRTGAGIRPDVTPAEKNRADVLEFDPDGSGMRIFAYGIRNCVGLGMNPKTGELWCSVNERDGLGDNLVPDYITHVQEGGFYGWPWWYLGGHQDPRLAAANTRS